MIESSDKPAARCGYLVEALAERYCKVSQQGVDIAACKRIVDRLKAQGRITVASPIWNMAAFEKRKHYANVREKARATAAPQLPACAPSSPPEPTTNGPQGAGGESCGKRKHHPIWTAHARKVHGKRCMKGKFKTSRT